jgi:ubiquinone biosynthesis protein UbiJ
MSVIKLIERAGNLVLSLDPETLISLADFKGKEFCIEILEPTYTVYLTPDTDGFTLNTAPTKESDVTLSGSLWSFMKLAREGSHSEVFHTGRIRMQGDAELGQAFQKVMMQLDIDWEEITSKIVGDFASRQLHNVMSEVKSWFGSSATHFKQNFGEVLQEEWKTVPATVEVELRLCKI